MQRLCDQFCDDCAQAVADRQPMPGAQELFPRIAQAGFRLRPTTWMRAATYLEGCRSPDRIPLPWQLLSAFFPRAKYAGHP